jgi:hypothetical protein
MNRRASVILCWLLFLVTLKPPTSRGEAAGSPDPGQVERVAAKLSAEQWRDRRDAMAWLVKAGPSAELPLRRLIDQTRDLEARNRAELVLTRIGQVRRTEPAIVNLTLDHVSVAQGFERLADIEGGELPTDPPDLLAHCDGTIDATYHGLTYWQTVLDLCRRTGLRLRFEDRGLVLAHGGVAAAAPNDALACSGVFLVRARLVRWSHDPRDPGRSVRLELYPEPRAEAVRADWKVPLAEAIDPHGQSLRPLAESPMNMAGATKLAGGGYSWYVPLRPVATSDTRLARFRGQVEVILAEQVVTGQAPAFAGDRTLGGPMPIHLPCGAVSASVYRMTKQDGPSWNMEMRVDTDPAEVDWDAVTEAMGTGGLRAFDADGRELALRSFWRAGGGPSNAMNCKWGGPHDPTQPAPGDPFKLVWRIPGKTVRVTVPFDLKDVTLAG